MKCNVYCNWRHLVSSFITCFTLIFFASFIFPRTSILVEWAELKTTQQFQDHRYGKWEKVCIFIAHNVFFTVFMSLNLNYFLSLLFKSYKSDLTINFLMMQKILNWNVENIVAHILSRIMISNDECKNCGIFHAIRFLATRCFTVLCKRFFIFTQRKIMFDISSEFEIFSTVNNCWKKYWIYTRNSEANRNIFSVHWHGGAVAIILNNNYTLKQAHISFH